MSDEKLIKYIKTVDAKFDSHLGNGTITMSIDYYNLIEELLARGINAIQKKQDFIKWLEDKITDLNEDIVNGRCQQNEIKRLRGYQEILDKVKEGNNDRITSR